VVPIYTGRNHSLVNRRGFLMRDRGLSGRAALCLCVLLLAGAASAQTVTLGGIVRDQGGQPIRGATVTGENPSVSPAGVTATTDDKGRFALRNLRSGDWKLTVRAPGYAPAERTVPVQASSKLNPPVSFALKAAGPYGLGMAARDLQADLAAADKLFNERKWDEAIAAYRAILDKAPSLSVINLQVGAAYRNKHQYDTAIAAYNDLLKSDPENYRAMIGIAETTLEKGDASAAEVMLEAAAKRPSATREVFASLGDIKVLRRKTDEAIAAYERAIAIDSAWARPLYALGTLAQKAGNLPDAIKYYRKAVEVEPISPEAALAKSLLDQLVK
jgi:predicted TPR repeat methyltransferase